MVNSKLTTLVVGASDNPARVSHIAVKALISHGIPVIAMGLRPGFIDDVCISESLPKGIKIDTITLYVRPEIQDNMKDELLKIKPRRIIFNPGTENPAFEKIVKSKGILTENACTLVLLNLHQYDDR